MILSCLHRFSSFEGTELNTICWFLSISGERGMLGKKFRKIPVQFISSLIGSFFFLYMTQGMIRTVLDVGIQVSMFFSLLGLGLLPTSSVSSHGDERGDRTVSSHQRNRAGRK